MGTQTEMLKAEPVTLGLLIREMLRKDAGHGTYLRQSAPGTQLGLMVVLMGGSWLNKLCGKLSDRAIAVPRPPGNPPVERLDMDTDADELMTRVEGAGWRCGWSEMKINQVPAAVFFFMGDALCLAVMGDLESAGCAVKSRESQTGEGA